MEESGSRTGWPSSSSLVWVNRQASLISRVPGLAVVGLARPAFGFAGARPARRCRRRRCTACPGRPPAAARPCAGSGSRRPPRGHDRAAAAPSASADRSTRLTVSSMPASSASSRRPRANGTADAGPGVHLGQARRQRRPGDTQLAVPGRQAVPAGGAVIPGAVQLHRPDHGVDGLGPVGDELRVVAVPAAGPRSAVAGVDAQQALQQPGRPA